MKNILITGATGFIGKHLVKEALKADYRVIVSVRKSSQIDWLEKQNVQIIILSLHDPEKLIVEIQNLINTIGAIDMVIHNAGLTQNLKSSAYYEINDILTQNLVVALKKSSKELPKFIFISSLAALGPGDPLTLKPIAEDDIPVPVTHYGKSKLKAEQFIQNEANLPWIIIRPTAVYGPGEKNFFNLIKAVNKGVEIYIGSKKQMLSFIHVFDLAEIIVKLCQSNISQENFNVSDGEEYTTGTVNKIIKSKLNKKTISIIIPIWLIRIIAFCVETSGKILHKASIINRDKVNELEQLNWKCDSTKIKSMIGFNAKLKLESGIKDTIDWYKKNDWL